MFKGSLQSFRVNQNAEYNPKEFQDVLAPSYKSFEGYSRTDLSLIADTLCHETYTRAYSVHINLSYKRRFTIVTCQNFCGLS